jgi:hypothetical protein
MLASIARLAQAVQDPGARDKAEDLEKTGELVHA